MGFFQRWSVLFCPGSDNRSRSCISSCFNVDAVGGCRYARDCSGFGILCARPLNRYVRLLHNQGRFLCGMRCLILHCSFDCRKKGVEKSGPASWLLLALLVFLICVLRSNGLVVMALYLTALPLVLNSGLRSRLLASMLSGCALAVLLLGPIIGW